jgi:16S rRNA processing protein RimM
MSAPERWVWLARVRRTQGRKGEVFADILTDFPEKFEERRKLWLLSSAEVAGENSSAVSSAREVLLVSHWQHKGGIVLLFAGVDSISAGEELAGSIVAIPNTERAELDTDAVYIGDLIGCSLIDVSKAEPLTVGAIEDVDRNAGQVALLVVKGNGGNEILVPFAKEYLRSLDVSAKRIEMALPEGLVDLNTA